MLACWPTERSLKATLVTMPALVGVAGLGMVLLPVGVGRLSVLVALWGMAFGRVSEVWSSWVVLGRRALVGQEIGCRLSLCALPATLELFWVAWESG